MPRTVTDRRMLTINEFCRAVGISRSGFYLLRSKGVAPRFLRLGDGKRASVRIPVEEVAAWTSRRLSSAA